MEVKENRFRIIAKPGSAKNEIRYDKEKDVYIVRIAAKAEDNKANIEIMKFLSKLLKKRAKIVSGFKSREKIIELDQ